MKRTPMLRLLLLLLLFWHPSGMAAPEKVAAVIKVKGSVHTRLDRATPYVIASRGQPLSQGNWIKTGSDEFASVIFLDATMLKIHEQSEVEIKSQRISATELSTKIYMRRGELWTKVKEGQRTEFAITTPTSVASVKGTEFYMEIDEIDGSTTITVIEGLVEFHNELGSILAEAMTSSRAEVGKAPEPAKKVSKTQVPTWQETVEPVWGIKLNPEKRGRQPIREPVKVGIQVVDAETQSAVRTYEGSATITTSGAGVKFSADGETWDNPLTLAITNGRGTVQVQANSTGNPTIIVSAENTESQKLGLQFYRTKSQKRAVEDKVSRLAGRKGFSDVEERLKGRNLQTSNMVAGSGSVDETLQKVDTGEYEIVSMEEVQNPDGTVTVKLTARPRPQEEN